MQEIVWKHLKVHHESDKGEDVMSLNQCHKPRIREWFILPTKMAIWGMVYGNVLPTLAFFARKTLPAVSKSHQNSADCTTRCGHPCVDPLQCVLVGAWFVKSILERDPKQCGWVKG